MRLPWTRDSEAGELREEVADLRDEVATLTEALDTLESVLRDELRDLQRSTAEVDAFENLQQEVNGHDAQINDVEHRLGDLETIVEKIAPDENDHDGGDD